MKHLLTICMLLAAGYCFAQNPVKPADQKSPPKKDSIYVIVEQMPMYPGGEVELMKFIQKNKKSCGVAGQVHVTFLIDGEGSVKDVRVLRSLSPSCDAEAVRVIQAMPKWEPGRIGGKPYPVQFNLPIRF